MTQSLGDRVLLSIGLRLRKVPPKLIVAVERLSNQSDLDVSINQPEARHRADGDGSADALILPTLAASGPTVP